MGETGLPLDINAVHEYSERFPNTKMKLDRSVSLGSGLSSGRSGSTPQQEPEEQDTINLRNLGPAASPVTSRGSSTVSSPGSHKGSMNNMSHPISTDSLSTILSVDNSKGEKADRNHVVDIPPALPDTRANHSRSEAAPDHIEVRIQDPSNELSTTARSVDQHGSEGPRAVDQSDPSSVPKPETPLPTVNNQSTSSSGTTSESVTRPSTRNVTAKKPPSSRLGPSNALAGIRILLAEDTPVLAKVATIMLEKMGARVVAVGDGMQAVETIGRSRGDQSVMESEEAAPSPVDQFDLVLMDCQVMIHCLTPSILIFRFV